MTRLATYNIHKFTGSDGKFDPGRIIAVIRDMAADVLAIQEFVPEDVRPGALGAEAFAAACAYRVIEQRTRRRNGKLQSNLLFTRVPMRDVQLLPLVFPNVDERGAICADVEIDGQILRVAATHLGLPPLTRRKQLQTILAQCDPGSARPFALIGDLNILPLIDPAERALRAVFPEHSQTPSFPSRWPLMALDRIALRGVRAVHAVQTWRGCDVKLASDHLPVVADVTFQSRAVRRA